MATFAALLAICAGNSQVTGEFPHKGQWRGALMFSLICLNKRLSKQSWGWWFEMPSCLLWRHSNDLRVPSLKISCRSFHCWENEITFNNLNNFKKLVNQKVAELMQCWKFPQFRRSNAGNFRGGPGTFCWFFFNFMFMIWDSRQEDLQLFWLSFKHWTDGLWTRSMHSTNFIHLITLKPLI